jgi:hypothetical protein
MSDIYEFSIEVDGQATDADGNELDKDGKPIESGPDSDGGSEGTSDVPSGVESSE